MLAGSNGTLVARLPAFLAVSCCSHAVPRGFQSSSPPPHRSWGWAASSLLFHAVPWPRSLRVLRIHSFEGSSRTSGYRGRLQSTPGPEAAVYKGEDQTYVDPRS